MKLKFDSELEYQNQAIQSVVDIFEGQQISNSVFTVAAGSWTTRLDKIKNAKVGIGNRLELTEEEILANLQNIQIQNGLTQTKDLHGKYDFDVEMETGTGKTYVYTRSMMELNKKYGFTKFVIVVPSLAIKEGVYKSLNITEDHFRNLYNNVPYDYFIYDSSKLDQVRNFALNDYISIMIINIDAFKRSFDDPDKDNKANIIHRENDKLNGLRPIDLIAETNPIVIIDEPQSVDTTDRSEKALSSLNPLCVFRYSATHVKRHNLIYRLDAIDSYELGLVKGIDVAGFKSINQHNMPYFKLLSVDNKKVPITAKIEIDSFNKNRSGIDRKNIIVKKGDDIFDKSKGREIYEGYIVDEIYCESGNEYVSFGMKPDILRIGQSIGDVDDLVLKENQIRKTIEEHLDKELVLNKRGIKVLSLFFIDKVSNYRNDDQKGKYAEMFEKIYSKLISRPKYASILKNENPGYQAESCHDGYFSIDKGVFKDSTGKSERDNETYTLIMKDKERLLSFDTKLRFIFSHSALREGWDNPNVFQICTLNETKSEVKKRQEIGRGMRLCVNQEGTRIHDPNVNQLTVIANESYEEFAAKLQNEYEKDSGIRFGIVEKHTFSNIILKNGEYLGQKNSEKIYEKFVEEGYIDNKGKVQDKLKLGLKNSTLLIPDDSEECRHDIISICRKITGSLNIKNNENKKKISINEKIYLSEEFEELWNKIKHKTKYNVKFDSEKLIDQCIENLNEMDSIPIPALQEEKARVEISASGVDTKLIGSTPTAAMGSEVELPDIIAYLQNRTELTRNTLVRILVESNTLNFFKRNPQVYMERVSQIIISNMRDMMVKGISYEKIGDTEFYSQEKFETEELFGFIDKNVVQSDKSIFDFVVYDSDVERDFAEKMGDNDRIKLFVKLPIWFKVKTPIGEYTPDWAILAENYETKKLYFVVETKGDTSPEALRKKEYQKILCGEMHFKTISKEVNFRKASGADEIFFDEVFLDSN